MPIYTIDTRHQNVPETTAVYLVLGPEGPVLIETGPDSTLPAVLEGLQQHNVTPADIQAIFVTHIHLDHAGAAGWWAAQGKPVYVHPRGAPHLIDPSRLWHSASRLYGADMTRLWGQMRPAPAEHVHAVADGQTVAVAGLTLTALETTGHARHHHTWVLDDVAFTGDVAGICRPGIDFLDIPAPPPEFDLEAWEASIDRLQQRHFATLYPTHFGPISDVGRWLARLRPHLREAASFVKAQLDAGLDDEQIVARYVDWLHEKARANGLTESEWERFTTAASPSMSVAGIVRYWRKRAQG